MVGELALEVRQRDRRRFAQHAQRAEQLRLDWFLLGQHVVVFQAQSFLASPAGGECLAGDLDHLTAD